MTKDEQREGRPPCVDDYPADLVLRLKRKNAELEQMIYVTSHDLRSPLVNVQGFSRELSLSLEELGKLVSEADVPAGFRRQVQPIIEEQIPEALNYILASSAKMDSLLTALLQVSRVGKADFVFETLDMNRLVHEVLQNFEYKFKEASIRIEVGDLPPCVADSSRVGQVLSNLLENSLKFLDPARPGRIEIGGEVREGVPTYFVRDNGIGIPRLQQAAVFDLFFTLAPERGGEGLGLAIVRRIIDKHGGQVCIESEQGAGCTIFFSMSPCALDQEGQRT